MRLHNIEGNIGSLMETQDHLVDDNRRCCNEISDVKTEVQELWARMMNAINMLNDSRDPVTK